MALTREHRRLRRAFTAVLVALAPAATAAACGHAGLPEVTPSDDAGTTDEASDDAPVLPDADAAPPTDAAEDRDCLTLITELDGGNDGDPPCLYTLPCGLPSALTVIGCEVYTAADKVSLGCHVVPGKGCWRGAYVPGPFGEVQIYCLDCLGGSGRRPRGLAKVRALGFDAPLGAYFARMAHDEAAAVYAFRRMRDELALHGAPARLMAAAERSARDEERHARAMARWARKHGALIPSPRVRRTRPRTLSAIARENAVEGCVHETFGALLLSWQAAHARDAALRGTLARMAADETRHAALAWAVARWAHGRLSAGARASVAAARARAVRALERRVQSAPFDDEVGRPLPAERALLLEGMIQRLGLAYTKDASMEREDR